MNEWSTPLLIFLGFLLGMLFQFGWRLLFPPKVKLPIESPPWKPRQSIVESISERHERQLNEFEKRLANEHQLRKDCDREKVERLRKVWPVGKPVCLSGQSAPHMTVIGHSADMTAVAGRWGMDEGVQVAWVANGQPFSAWYPPPALMWAPTS